MNNKGVVALSVAVIVLAGLLVFVLMRPASAHPVNVIYTEDLYPRYRNWDLWPIPMFHHSMPFGGPRHKTYPPPPPHTPGELPTPPAPSTPVPPPMETFASV